MEKLKTLTLDGKTYTVEGTDIDHLLVVNISEDKIADCTAYQIYEHVQNGGTAVACYMGMY